MINENILEYLVDNHLLLVAVVLPLKNAAIQCKKKSNKSNFLQKTFSCDNLLLAIQDKSDDKIPTLHFYVSSLVTETWIMQ